VNKNPFGSSSVLGAAGVAAGAVLCWAGAAAPEMRRRRQSPGHPGQGRAQLLFYRNPWDFRQPSPVPRRTRWAWTTSPVYEGEEPAGPELKISLDRVQKLGVKNRNRRAARVLTRGARRGNGAGQ